MLAIHREIMPICRPERWSVQKSGRETVDQLVVPNGSFGGNL